MTALLAAIVAQFIILYAIFQKRFMYKLEEEERLTIVYYLHKARPVRSRFKRGLDGKALTLQLKFLLMSF